MAYNFPPVNKIFDDLDRFRDFCRMGGFGDSWGYPFDEKDLYNNNSPVWQAYQKYVNYVRSKNKNRFNNNGTKRFYDRRGGQ